MMVFSSYRPHESRCRLEQESTSSCVKHYRNSISLDWSWKFRARPFLQTNGPATCGNALFLTSKAHEPLGFSR
jgi:hypothetical protein